MKPELLLLMSVIMRCFGVKLSPLENNDKLQDIMNLYVAEWQWESWPMKEDLLEQEAKSPGQRKNMALWRDNSKSAWYLFGGQPVNSDSKKVYSDVWKFTVKTRMWKKFFPSQGEVKSTNANKKGETTTLRSKIFNKRNISYFEPFSHSVVLCGITVEKNSTKVKNLNEWSTFRRKKLGEEKNAEELTYLAVYAPITSKSNTVWQIDVKEKLWTAYVCYCDTSTSLSSSLAKKNKIPNGISKNSTEYCKNATKNTHSAFDSKINSTEDEIANEQQHLSINNLKNKKKKINQVKKSNEKSHFKKLNIEKRKDDKNESNLNETKFSTAEEASKGNKSETVGLINKTRDNIESQKEEYVLKAKNTSKHTEGVLQVEKPDEVARLKIASNYCPEVAEDSTFLTWCDGKNKALVSVDIGSVQVTVWVYDLSTSHWSQLQVRVSDGEEWPNCLNIDSVRYAGNEEEVYLVCSRLKKQTNASLQDSTNPTKIPSESNFNIKLVYRINYKENTLHNLGEIRFNSYFNSPEGEKVWQNDILSNLQVLKNSDNDTILIFAYGDVVDLWILNKNGEGKEGFDLMEKVWRGSALKWFDKYNAALYNLQFISESGNSETILFPNPRKIGVSEYWPRERGRFIIRIFRNENFKNQSFENRTREQNLTYELLQSDYKSSGAEHQLNQMYSLKVLVFFGISLAIFSIFGFVVFLKKCVNCPPRIRVRNECHKSPLIIRYSVIPDDLLYPVA